MVDTQTEQTTHAARWQSLKRQYRMLWAALLTFVPVVGGIGFGAGLWFGSLAPFFGLALIWAIWLIALNMQVSGFACPQCGRPFFRRDDALRADALQTRCVHCALPKWATDPMVQENTHD